MNVAYAMLTVFQSMMSLELRVEVDPTIHVTIAAAAELFIVFVWEIGCVLSQQRGNLLMFCLGIAPTVWDQLL